MLKFMGSQRVRTDLATEKKHILCDVISYVTHHIPCIETAYCIVNMQNIYELEEGIQQNVSNSYIWQKGLGIACI